MKQKDILALVVIGIIAAVISSIAAGAIFNSSKQKPLKVAEVQKIDSTFPQVKNDPAYSAIFNEEALNPTQLIQIGTSQNPTPFKAADQ